MRIADFYTFCTLALCVAAWPALAEDGFQAGKDFGAATKSGTASGVNDAQARAVFPGYTDNSPESGYLSRAATPFQQGDDKKARCATQTDFATDADHQDCDAVKYLSQIDGSNPFTLDKQNDPLVQSFKSAMQNKPDFNSLSSTQCTTKTTNIAPTFITEICDDYASTESHSCSVGQLVEVDAKTNYQCDQTVQGYENLSCNKNLVVASTITHGCAPGTLIGEMLVAGGGGAEFNFDVYCAAGGYLVEYWLRWHYTSHITFFKINVPATVGETLDMGKIYDVTGCVPDAGCTLSQAWLKQVCDADSCLITFSILNSDNTITTVSDRFGTPSIQSFTEVWDNQCASLEARTL